MKTLLQPDEAFRVVRESNEQIRDDETQTLGAMSPGDNCRQGDVYLVCVTGKFTPAGPATTNRQLAPGESQGSRHIVQGDVTVYPEEDKATLAQLVNSLVKNATVDPALVGPVVVCNTTVELTHPEHANFTLPQGETFVCVFQRAHAEEVRRQLD